MALTSNSTSPNGASIHSLITVAACSLTGFCSYKLYQKQQDVDRKDHEGVQLLKQCNTLRQKLQSAHTEKSNLESLYKSLRAQYNVLEVQMRELKKLDIDTLQKYKEEAYAAEEETFRLGRCLDDRKFEKEENEEIHLRITKTINDFLTAVERQELNLNAYDDSETAYSTTTSNSIRIVPELDLVDGVDRLIQRHQDKMTEYESLYADHTDLCVKYESLYAAYHSTEERIRALTERDQRQQDEIAMLRQKLEALRTQSPSHSRTGSIGSIGLQSLESIDEMNQNPMVSVDPIDTPPLPYDGEGDEVDMNPTMPSPLRSPSPSYDAQSVAPSSPGSIITDLDIQEISGPIVDPLTCDLSIKRALKWTHSKQRWSKVCRSATVGIVQDEDSGKMMVVIKQRAGEQMIHFYHALPHQEDAHFKCNEQKLSCQWLVEWDSVQREQDMTVFVYFRRLEAFRGFINCFQTLPR